MNYYSFCKKYRPTKKQLYTEFYQLIKDKIGIKNQRIAVEKISKIITATFKLSAKQSFANMSLRELSKESKISMGGLYAYIQSKQQLALCIHEFLNYFVIKTIKKVTSHKDNNTLESLIKTHIYLSEFLQPWFFFVFMESKNLNRNQKKMAIQSELLMETKLKEVIKISQNQKQIKSLLTAEIIASLTKPLLSEWYLKRWKYKKRDISIDEYCQAVMIYTARANHNR